MPKPLKSLLIVFSILVFAGILALALNAWQWPVGDDVTAEAPAGAGQVSQSAETAPQEAVTAPSQAAGETPDQAAGQPATGQPDDSRQAAAPPPAGESPAGAQDAAEADGDAGGETVAAVTPAPPTAADGGAMPQGETAAADDAPAAAPPAFDIVRVEPSGDTVVAGRSGPGAAIELLSNGSVIATTTANAAGEFVLVLEKPLAAGGHDLALRTSGKDGVSVYSKTNVAVAVPENPSGEVLVVMSQPGAASEILAKPDEPASVDTGTETVAQGEAVVAVAPPDDISSGETQVAAAPPVAEPPVAEPPAAEPEQPAEAAAPGEPPVTEPLVAEPPAAAPPAAEPQTPPETAQTAPAAPAPPETAQTTAAPPPQPETPAPPAEMAAQAEPTQPQPEMAGPASGEKPMETADAPAAADEPATAAIASPAPVPLAVEAVEVEDSRLYAAGTAGAGAIVRLYVDDALTGETISGGNGRWLLETEAKVPAGTVIVRADQLAPATAEVVARAEVPFTRRVDTAVLIPSVSGGAPTGAAASGDLPRPNAVIIRRGDNLWTISRRTYGRGIRYTTIYTANKDQIRNPHLIYPGQVFVLPVGDKSWTQ